MLKDHVDSLTIKRDWYLEELEGVSAALSGIHAIVKVKLLMQDVEKNNEALDLAHTSLSKMEVALNKENHALWGM